MGFWQNFSRILMEFHGFPWESFQEALGFWPFPLEFLGKKLEFPWNWKAKWLRLQPIAFHWNSMEFRGILTFHLESGGIHRNSWRRVKTSTQLGHHHQMSCCHVVSPHRFIVSPQPCQHSFGWWRGIIFGGQQPMWAVDGRCGRLRIDVGSSGHGDCGDGQWCHGWWWFEEEGRSLCLC